MSKNRFANQNTVVTQRESERNRNAIVLILALLFFLFGLWAWADAKNFTLFDQNGRFNPSTSTTRTGQPGTAGSRGSNGNSGESGSGGSNGQTPGGTDTETSTPGEDLNVNVKTDTGLDVDAGIKDGQLHVDPKVNPDAQGGSGAKVDVNKDTIIDTKSVLP